jgi:hypothetical protein
VSIRQGLIRKGVLERRGAEYRLFSDHFEEVVRRRRSDLAKPLSVPEEPLETRTAEAAVTEAADSRPPAAMEASTSVADAAAAEGPVSPGTVIETSDRAAAPCVPTSPVGGPSAPIALPVPVDSELEPTEGLSEQELSSLSALGCYVSAISVDLVFIAGIVVARLFFRLPAREMYVMIGVSAVLPAVFLLLGRVGGGLWTRVFGWLVGRL